jgi:hypothetical protein
LGLVGSANFMRLSLKSFTGVADRKSLHCGRDDKGEG